MAHTILLVEDEAILALAESDTLRRYGYAVVTAHSGAAAVSAAKDPAVDLVLMDIDLGPGMDGTEAAARILRDRDIPIVFLSSHTEPAIVEKTETITSYGYVVKDSGDTVLDASIKMAYRLFAANSELKKKESLLKESEEKYRLLYEQAGLGIGYYTPEGVVISFNEQALANMGARSEDVVGKSIHDLFPGAEAERYMGRLMRALESDESTEYEDSVDLPAGSFCYSTVFRRIRDESGSAIGVQLISKDITERKRAEAALRESERKLHHIEKNFPGILFQARVAPGGSFGFTYVSPRAYDLFGFHLALDDPRWEPGINMHPDDRERYLQAIASAIASGGDFRFEGRFLPVGGKISWFQALATASRIGDEIFYSGVIIDITELRLAEEALRESERRSRHVNALLRHVFDNAIIGMFISSPDGKFKYVNQAIASILGYDTPDALMRAVNETSIADALYEDPARRPLLVSEVESATGGWKIFENRYRRKDGEIIDAILSFCEMTDPESDEKTLYGFVRDVTEKKRAEEALLESEERFRTLFEYAPVLIDAFDENGRCILWNKECERVFGWTMDDINAHEDPLALFYPDPEVRREVVSSVTAIPRNSFREWHPVTREGVELTTQWANFMLPDGMVINIGMDFTERRKAEEALAAALEEKTALLAELQHRVKNSLALISSLVSLQASGAADDSTRAVLMDVESRIMSIARLYGQLYESGGYARIDLRDYLTRIINGVQMGYMARQGVRIRASIDFATCSFKTASSLGIILNELLTNAFKYAFPGERTGAVSVSLTRKDESFALHVEDDGAGLPPGFDLESSQGMGMQLVRLLAKQHRGAAVVDPGGRASFTVTVVAD
ncbi:MAG TPA: PAS domain S-box protein [Spirochaetota bacterium]|nr:PAS domain S-box protein [Spirochaetota bacterium]